mmetsp:Transcript_35693/g.31489  ORF Transcript_35693/g.31489 Transcript_35693/m.31489 type:complete len:312 (+) Transcript_35693:1-936(+)
MDRNSRRREYSNSRSPSQSRSRSRSRERKADRRSKHKSRYSSNYKRKRNYSDRNDEYRSKYHRHSRSKYNDSNQDKHQSSMKSIMKTEDKKLSFQDNKKRKSVKFDESTDKKEDDKDKKEKKKEDFNASGALKRDLETTKNGVVLKYNEPPEGCKCSNRRFRLYEYKSDEQQNVYYIHRKSFYLIGRDERVAEIHCRHPSISSQHAVIQYRRIKKSNSSDGNSKSMVKPYIMDLKSRHGTFLMGDRIESHRYYELLPKDVLKFGVSSREYIVLADDSNEKDITDKSEIELNDQDRDAQKPKENIWSDDEDE